MNHNHLRILKSRLNISAVELSRHWLTLQKMEINQAPEPALSILQHSQGKLLGSGFGMTKHSPRVSFSLQVMQEA